MKILMLTPYLPFPPSSGGQVRSYNLIRILAKKHEITLFCLIKDEKERRFVKELEKYCKEVKVFNRPVKPWTFKNIIRTGFGKYPFLVIRNFSDEEKKVMKDELKSKKYDLIHAENFYVMPHIPETNVPILLMEQTIFYKVYKHFSESLPWFLFFLKLPLFIDVAKLKFWEFYYWKKADVMAAVSEEDRNLIKKSVGRKNVAIVPNGVDFLRFNKKLYKKEDKPTILFGVADFHWMQNKEGVVNLINKVWPAVKEQVKDAKLWIVGKIAPKALSEFCQLEDVVIREIG
ncbi:glycosyltransferase family 4 protein, partial [Patescibacteria group bacterium]|nr:glycosyltransferase family 4 protein [Patescibacteria group bacterium]